MGLNCWKGEYGLLKMGAGSQIACTDRDVDRRSVAAALWGLQVQGARGWEWQVGLECWAGECGLLEM